MNLLVDLGNSRIKWAQGDSVGAGVVFAAVHSGALAPHLDRDWINMPRPARIFAAVVAGPSMESELLAWTVKHWGIAPEFVRAQASAFGVTNRYHFPERLGADRWAALVGARHLFPGHAACVVDCGTALTFNALTAGGEFLGGAIMPGLSTARRSLRDRAHGIPAEPQGNEEDPIARTTADAVAAGTVFGLAGAVDRLVEEYRARLGADMRAIFTGGDARTLATHTRRESVLVPDLVLRGLAYVATISA